MDIEHKLILIILDGFGLGPNPKVDAIAQAKKPYIDLLFKKYPWTKVSGSGEDVGLPDGQMGNSEVGHMNIGAGRVVYQEITRINRSIRMGDFFEKPAFLGAIDQVKKNNSALHFIGLVSDGGVHSLNTHLYALLELAKRNNLTKVYVHAILDGRDTPPENGVLYLKQLQNKMKELGVGKIATVSGRYYTMDRDTRWDRTEKAYRALTDGTGEKATDPIEAVKASYAKGLGDEFVLPVIIEENGKPVALVKDGDAMVFFNFRTDRTRQLTRAFIDDAFDKFPRKKLNIYFSTMTLYHEDFKCPVAFPPTMLTKTLGEIISNLGLKQFHLAETEKYAHVTFFFNGGREEPYPGEDRALVPSPRGVATYDLKPEMSALEVTEKAVEAISSQKYSFIIMNYANCDMVGHSGKMDAAIKAVETINECLGKIVPTAQKNGYVALITADHGNAEQMVDENGEPHTAHTTNLVPFIVVEEGFNGKLRERGILADIAPTVLKIMGIPQPPEMEGKSLIV
jgi:2,3-bisphosphoglycerate-independent phosphoglycerate mutase